MRVNWFSPLPPAKTGIADYTLGILPTLSKHVEVTLWTDQTSWDPVLEKYARIKPYKPERMPWPEFNQAELSFYNLGNNHLFHASIWQVSQRAPGIIVLHDFRLHDFFDSLYRRQWRDQRGYLRQMETYYGETGLAAAKEFVKDEAAHCDSMAERFTFTDLALGHSLGVLVHTREVFDDLQSRRTWPVVYSPLPSAITPDEQRREAIQQRSNQPLQAPYRLIIFGHIGRNRQLEAILKALGQLPAKDAFRLDIFGQVDNLKALRQRIRENKLGDLV